MSSACVYFIKPVGMDGPIKIGCSSGPIERVKQLMCWSPVDLEILHHVPGDFALERRVHEAFADLHQRNEWFSPGERLVGAIEAMQRGVPLDEAVDLNDVRGTIQSPAYRGRWNAARRRKVSFTLRVTHACKRIRRGPPPAVSDILRRWVTTAGYRYVAGVRVWEDVRVPTDDEIAALEAFIANPFARAAA